VRREVDRLAGTLKNEWPFLKTGFFGGSSDALLLSKAKFEEDVKKWALGNWM